MSSHNQIKYSINDLKSLPNLDNIASTNLILEDIKFRKTCLSNLRKSLQAMVSTVATHPYVVHFNEKLNEAKIMENSIETIENEIINLQTIFNDIDQCTTNYINILKDDDNEYNCSRFIRNCELLRVRIEQLEIEETFPKLTEKMNLWKNIYDTDEQFKPKIIELLETIEKDLLDKYGEESTAYAIPYKVGILGSRSVGKSTFSNYVRDVTNEQDPLFSPTALEKSTFCYLQFDKEYPYRIEGCTDNEQNIEFANYINEIGKADCDLYLILYDREFSQLELSWKRNIENVLNRKCLIVRTKVDRLFLDCYEQMFRTEFNENSIDDQHKIKRILDKVRIIARTTHYGEKLEEVYLMAAKSNRSIRNTNFANFDKDKLIQTILQLALSDGREERLRKMAIIAAADIINTCFRRGSIISVMKYKIAAGILSIVPLADEIPRYVGREKVRQVFGIHDQAYLTNKYNETTDKLQTYLLKYQFYLPQYELSTDAFKYLVKKTKDTDDNQTNTNVSTTTMNKLNPTNYTRNIQLKNVRTKKGKILQKLAPVGGRVLLPIFAATDDIVRVAVPAAAAGLRVGLTAATAGIGFVLSIPLCAWAAISNGKQIHNYLHLLCDDLLVLIEYFITAVINRCLEDHSIDDDYEIITTDGNFDRLSFQQVFE
ncbi:unnamed protein product [Didymodactylos carnosus]|uniref:Uncharacterized protein n=1 Tax=Didymodactylos carnosus TaxID=1234261 RepID=A0A815B8W1_9BILA|nr:unnamed protein product [Didymodactylos carnosus]CAF1270358.1 unnamed protein product [Didymodactylos carnosus]CAF4013998.1 unnamed protein product [Didymodactylos carnosus]CAF4058080.1 unnamed protein product [Didymodactylos carnosus]